MTNKKENLPSYYYGKIAKSLNYLEYSYQRVQKLPTDPKALTNEGLETWDGFAVRFAPELFALREKLPEFVV